MVVTDREVKTLMCITTYQDLQIDMVMASPVAQKQNGEMMSLSQKSLSPNKKKRINLRPVEMDKTDSLLDMESVQSRGGSGPVPLIIFSVILTLVPRKGVRFRLSPQSSREFMIAVYKNGLQLKLNSNPFPTYSCVTVHDTLSNWIEFSIP